MQSISLILLSLGGILLVGLFTDLLGQRTLLPRVTLLLLFGLLLGREGLDLVPAVISNQFEIIADIALVMVGFLLGGRLTAENLRNSAGQILWISITAAVGTSLLVFAGLVLAGMPVEIALLLGCIAAATAPAATVDTVLSSGCEGPFADSLLAIVALDDAWGLILFSLSIAVVTSMQGVAGAGDVLQLALHDIGGAVLLGVAIGLPAAFLTGRIRPGEPMLTEALGLVFICGGAAIALQVSFLIAAMVMGAVVANLARHHEYPFHAIEGVEWPFMALFFVLAGASLEIHALLDIGLLALVYIVCRTAGKIFGAWAGGSLGGAGLHTRCWMGLALLPQAGAAIGMALVAANRFPEFRQVLLPVVISSTIFFELVGPVLTRLALQRARPVS